MTGEAPNQPRRSTRPLHGRAGRDAVADYRAARAAVDATAPGTSVHAFAEQALADLGPRPLVLAVPCLLCPATGLHTTTVAEAAALCGPPRGLCHDCA